MVQDNEVMMRVCMQCGRGARGANGAERKHLLPKARLSAIEHCHHMDGWPLCAQLQSEILC